MRAWVAAPATAALRVFSRQGWNNPVIQGWGITSMFDLTVVAKGGRWVLVDDEAGELGDYGSRAEALLAAGEHEAAIDDELRYVLIQEEAGEWEEAVVEPPKLH